MGDQITISSTTGSQQDLEDALQHDLDVEHGESPRSPGHVYITTTTGDQASTDEAAEMFNDKLVTSDGEGHITPVITSEDGAVATTTGDKAGCEEAAEDLREEQQARSDAYLGRSRFRADKRINQLVAQREEARSEAAALRQQLAQRQPAQPAQPAQNDQGQQPQAQQPQPQQQYTQADYEAHMQARDQALQPAMEEIRKAVPDFDTSLKHMNENYALSEYQRLVVLDAPNAPAVAYWLSKNPVAVHQLWQLENSGNGQGVMQAIQNLAVGLDFHARQAAQQPQPARRSREQRETTPVPQPISPLRGTSAASANKSLYDEGLSYQEHKALMERQERRR